MFRFLFFILGGFFLRFLFLPLGLFNTVLCTVFHICVTIHASTDLRRFGPIWKGWDEYVCYY